MENLLYAKDGKIYCKYYTEIYVPEKYFKDGIAATNGGQLETFGIIYIEGTNGNETSGIKILNIPTMIKLQMYDFVYTNITIPQEGNIKVMALKYMPNSFIMNQTVTEGREVAETFLDMMLGGKLPKTIQYKNLIDMWWKNLQISGITLQTPSKIYEMIIATMYRNPNNMKERFGQIYGRQTNPNEYGYKTGNVRENVKNLSTFSGFVFEDMGNMISNGIANSIDNVEEKESPLEKIIYM